MRENKTRYWIVLIIFVVLSTAAIPLVSGYVLDKSRTLDHTTFLFDYA